MFKVTVKERKLCLEYEGMVIRVGSWLTILIY